MLKIQFPPHEFQIRKEDNKELIFDVIRKKWVPLTPEEWVRQNFLQYLLQEKKYPASLLSVEKEVRLADVRKRCDIVAYKNNLPWMIVECKEMNVSLDEKVLQQIIQYNMAVPVEFLVITNGRFTYAWQRFNNQLQSLDTIPFW